MEINSPEDLVKAIASLLVQMNRKQRKQFLMWVKSKRKEFDFKYPEGYVVKEEINVQPYSLAECSVAAPNAPVLLVPDTGIVIPTDPKIGS